MVTFVPASAVPLSVGVLSSVACPFVRLPVIVPASSATVTSTGTVGKWELDASKLVSGPTLPARS